MTTSMDDPFCDTGFGGYVNLEDFGIFAQDTLVGDTMAFDAFGGQNPFEFFGGSYSGASFPTSYWRPFRCERPAAY